MGNPRVALFLAYKSVIKGNRWALVLTVLVMALSFVNLIFTSAILSGVIATLDSQLIDTTLSHIIISPPENKYYIENVSLMENQVRQFPEVTGISPRLITNGFFEYRWEDKRLPNDKGKSGEWQVIGVDPAAEAGVTAIHEKIIEGQYLADGDRDEIVLGVEIAGGPQSEISPFLTLGGVKVGEKVRVTYPNGLQREYTVKGIFKARELVNADHLAFVTRPEMASVLGKGVFQNRASQLLVRTGDKVNLSSLIQGFQMAGVGGQIRSWQEYGGALRSMVSTFDVIASLIGGVGLIVAAIVMFIVIYINVVNKRRQIGIMRAIGIRQNIIIGSYLVQALLFAITGITVGWLIIHFGLEPYFVAHPLELPIGMVSLQIQQFNVASSAIGLIIAAILAGFVPSWATMKQSIIKAIWGT